MKSKQTLSYSFVGAVTLAFIPSYLACRSQTDAIKPSPDVSTVMEVPVQTPVNTPQTGPLLQTGQSLGVNRFASMPPVAQVVGGNTLAGSLQSGAVQPVTQVPAAAPVIGSVVSGVNVIDLAICLDTSGSMDGLIDSAKQTLWAIVNDLALVEPAPVLRVALLSFGNDGHSAENGWVSLDLPLTSDLDAISEKLFALSTNGGTELVGRVVNAATKDLAWSTNPNALKLLVVAGNESADQDQAFPFREASKAAITAGIMVNSIYCGSAVDEFAAAWREVSMLADGHFASIDKDNGMIVIDTPFDEELAALTASVNGTYVRWGQGGVRGQQNQITQDLNNGNFNNDAMAQRAMAKNSALYSCSWDLVDARKADQVKVEDLDRQFLSEELQAMTNEELEAHIKAKGEERAKIQANVAEVASKRQVWLAEERMKLQVDDSKSMDRVMRDAIRAQAATKGIQFKALIPAPSQEPATSATTLAPKVEDC